MTNDTRPPVAPKEGHYAMLRNGCVVHPECITKEFDLDGTHYYLPANSDEDYHWTPQGVCQRQTYPNGVPKVIFVPDFDIIATISPEAMALAASMDMTKGAKDVAHQIFDLRNRLARLEALIPLADAVCDYADSHCRAFPIATAPKEGVFLAWDNFGGEWEILAAGNESFYHPERFTHWAPLPPPPTNPPLPAVFIELGQALEKIKEGR